MTVAQTVLKNSIVLFIAEIIRRALSFVVVLLIARRLGVEIFGEYSFVFAFVSMFAPLSNFGFDTLLIKDISREIDNTRKKFFSFIFLKFVTSLFTSVFIIAFIHFFHYKEEIIKSVYIMAISSIFISLGLTTISLCNAHQRMEYSSLIQILRNFALFILVLIIFHTNDDIVKIFMAHLAANVLQFSFGILLILHWISPINFVLDVSLIKQLFKRAAPFVMIGAIAELDNRIDVLMLLKMTNATAVGLYSAAYTPMEVLIAIPTLLTQALFPAFSTCFSQSLDTLKILAIKSFKVFLILSLPMVLGITILSGQFIDLMFSEDYQPAAQTLRVFGFGIWILFLQILFSWLLTAMDKIGLIIKINCVGLIVKVVLNFCLIPVLFETGAAIALVISNLVNLALFSVAAYKSGVVSLSGINLDKIVLASTAMGILVYAIRGFTPPAVVSLAAVFYFGTLVIIGAMSRDEIAALLIMTRSLLRH
jgi:O-antigen/teichoic acid export membrane protein